VTGIRWLVYDAFSHEILWTHAGRWTPLPYDPEVDPKDPNQFNFRERILPLKPIESER